MCHREKISIIIPCYNAEKYIETCLDSVINQRDNEKAKSEFDMEIICVDDCSTDNTQLILQDYEKKYPEIIMVILLPTNCKQGAARNIGLSYASGNYIIYVDSDDILVPNAISILYNAIKNTDLDFVRGGYKQVYFNQTDFCDVETVNGNKNCEQNIKNSVEIYDMDNVNSRRKYLVKYGWNTAVWAKIYKKDFLLQNKIDFPERGMRTKSWTV